jgi:hypothetical protein
MTTTGAGHPESSAARRKARRLAWHDDGPPSHVPESAQLRMRVIALENLVIALLVRAPESQLALVREMATHISPRPGFTAHRLTLRAAEEMRSLVGRASRFRAATRGQINDAALPAASSTGSQTGENGGA